MTLWANISVYNTSDLFDNVSGEAERNGSTQQDSFETMRSRASAILVLTLTVNLIGNCLLVASLLRSTRSSRYELGPVQSLMLQTAFADLAFALCGILPQLLRMLTLPHFHGNDFMCRLVSYVQVVPMFATSYFGVAIAVDRYIAICMPLASIRFRYSRVRVLTTATWIVALLFALPQFAIFRLQSAGSISACASTRDLSIIKPYMVWFCISAWLGPTLIISVFYSSVLSKVWQSSSTTFKISTAKHRGKTYARKFTLANLYQYVAAGGHFQLHSTASTDTSASGTELGLTKLPFKRHFWSSNKSTKSSKSDCGPSITQSSSSPGLLHHKVSLHSNNNLLCIPEDQNKRTLSQCLDTPSTLTVAASTVDNSQQPVPQKPYALTLKASNDSNDMRLRRNSSAIVSADISKDKHGSYQKTKPPLVTRRKIQTIKLTLTIIICHFVLWSPFCITGFAIVFFPQALNGAAAAYILLTGNLNSCVNPWIYFFFHRNRLSQLLCGRVTRLDEDQTSGCPNRKLTLSAMHPYNNYTHCGASSAIPASLNFRCEHV